MADLAKDAGVKVRGGLGVLPLVALLASCGGGGEGGSSAAEADLIVLAVTPTNSQETLPDLSDPEVDGKVTFTFTAPLKAGAIIDPTNAYNSLTPYVQVLDQTFSRVRGTPSVDNATQTLSFTPEGGILAPAQYTVTLSKFVGSPAGKLLNYGLKDYSTSFTVGPDVYSPVIRNTTPAPNQLDTPLFSPIVITFNESISPTTAVLGQTVFVQDGGTNPPTQLGGTLTLDRNGFDLVFTPDPCVGLPPSTTIVVRLLGVGNTTYIRDLANNGFVGDPANNNEFQLQFNTKGVKPVVSRAIGPRVNQPRINPFTAWSSAAYAVTNRGTYAFDTANVIRTYLTTSTIDPSLTAQVKRGVAGGYYTAFPLPAFASGTYNGDWEALMGKPGEAVVDWRVDTATGHSYIYQLDEANDAVLVIHSGNGDIEGRLRGVGSPKGITISGPGATGNSPVLFVSNYAQGTVTGIPIGLIRPGQPICEALQDINTLATERVYLQTGKNPNGVACHYFGLGIGAVVNQADNELQIFDPQSLQPLNTGVGNISQRFTVGENPVDVAFSPYYALQNWIFAYVVNQGGPTNPDGSVSLWWNSTGLIGLFNSTSGSVPSTLTKGIKSPGRPTPDERGFVWVCNTASDDVVRATISAQGSGIGAAISLNDDVFVRKVGANPMRMALTGNITGGTVFLGLVALAGDGQVGVWDVESVIGPPHLYPLPGVTSMFSVWDQ